MDVPDLLHPRARARVDFAPTRAALAIAFASGVSGGLFGEALDAASVAPSTWQPSAFAGELFLPAFVASCFRIRIDGVEPLVAANHLLKVLASPPAEVAVVHHRRAILAELVAEPALRARLEELYVRLCAFRALLEGASGAGKWDPNRRQLDLLALAREIFDGMAGFAGAQSGLARLGAFGRRVQNDEPYRSLVDLLRYDEGLATLDVKVAIGADGRIRGFDVVSTTEHRDNVFHGSPWRRWLAKTELFVRGYRFGDGEVMARLVDAVFDGIHDDLVHFVQLLGDLEVYLGALGFRELAMDRGLDVCLPDLVEVGEPLALEGLFNPFLVAQTAKVVPCNVRVDRHDRTTLVTGPNSGGKTRLLQSLGIAQLLAQAGLFVPARSARMSFASGLVVSLTQETHAEQTEGRLGMELIRIRDLFDRLSPGAMVLLDELCSGTNPSEGEEIFELVVRMLTRLEPQAFITTHFLVLAARLEREASIDALRFLQVELGHEHRPTYQFTPGVARTSLAAQAAARLGITSEQLLAVIDRKIALAAAAQ